MNHAPARAAREVEIDGKSMNEQNPKQANFADFLSSYPGVRRQPADISAIDYTALSIDTRTLEQGDLFVALRGELHDGHTFVKKALESGAVTAVVDQRAEAFFQKDLEAVNDKLIVVENTLDFLQQLAAWHRNRFDIPLIAVTGSNGKTTTREMIGAVLATRYRVLLSEGNKNNHIGLPLTLLRIGSDTEIAVVELGTNHPGEIGHLTGLARPTAAVITNIGKGHLGYFGSLDSVYEEKTALFREIPDHCPRFINMEDIFLARYPAGQQSVFRVGMDSDCDVCGELVEEDRLGRITFVLNGRERIKLPLPGRHQVMNALLAAAVGLYAGIDIAGIREALQNFTPAGQRMEITERDGILFINDAYNANPDSMRAALLYLAGLSDGVHSRIAVLGDMLELGEFAEEEHAALGRFAAGLAIDRFYFYGPQSRHALDGVRSVNPDCPAAHYQSHAELAADLKSALNPATAVLLKGSRGMTMEKVLTALTNSGETN